MFKRIFFDFAGRAPAIGDYSTLALSPDLAPIERRKQLTDAITQKILSNSRDVSVFESRVVQYFNNVFGMNLSHGSVLNICEGSQTTDCISEQAAADFRDEPAMQIARIWSGFQVTLSSYTNESGEIVPREVQKQVLDIREILKGQSTLFTKSMADVLQSPQNVNLKESLGLANISPSSLARLPQLSDQWYWLDRKQGPQIAGAHQETHSGILTTPAFLLRGKSHLARANNFYSWFLCRNLEQAEQEFDARERKLAKKSALPGLPQHIRATGILLGLLATQY